jgi:hypothetical protein
MHLTNRKSLLLQLAHKPDKPKKSLQKNAKVPLSTAGSTSSNEHQSDDQTADEDTGIVWDSQEHRNSLKKGKSKSKVNPITGHEGPEVE